MHTADTTELPHRFARVRMAVGFLGQIGLFGWWSSSLLSPNGLAIANYNFPRAPGYASLNATTAAAKRLHDEVSIQRAIQLNGRVFLEPAFQRREDALGALEAESREVISVDAGPVQIGSLDDAFTELGLSELAKHYFAAFRQEIQSLPYFANAKK